MLLHIHNVYSVSLCKIKTMEKKRKNIDLSKKAIEKISIDAIENGTVFKLHAEAILEKYANLIESEMQESDVHQDKKK